MRAGSHGGFGNNPRASCRVYERGSIIKAEAELPTLIIKRDGRRRRLRAARFAHLYDRRCIVRTIAKELRAGVEIDRIENGGIICDLQITCHRVADLQHIAKIEL